MAKLNGLANQLRGFQVYKILRNKDGWCAWTDFIS